MLEVAVDRGVHGDRLDAELAAGAQDAQRDLAAVGDDDFVEHGALFDDEQGLAELDRFAVLRQIATILPALSASIWFIIFMASMMHSTWPILDLVADLDEGLRAGEAAA